MRRAAPPHTAMRCAHPHAPGCAHLCGHRRWACGPVGGRPMGIYSLPLLLRVTCSCLLRLQQAPRVEQELYAYEWTTPDTVILQCDVVIQHVYRGIVSRCVRAIVRCGVRPRDGGGESCVGGGRVRRLLCGLLCTVFHRRCMPVKKKTRWSLRSACQR